MAQCAIPTISITFISVYLCVLNIEYILHYLYWLTYLYVDLVFTMVMRYKYVLTAIYIVNYI